MTFGGIKDTEFILKDSTIAKPDSSHDYASGIFSPNNSLNNSLSATSTPKTVFQQLDAGRSGVNRSVAHIKTNQSFCAEKAVTNKQEASKSLSAGRQEVKTIKASMETDYKQAKAEAIACLKEAAGNQGLNGDDVVAQICPSADSGGSSAALVSAAGATLATGGVASALGAACVAVEISKQDRRNLSPNQRESLIEDTVKIAQTKVQDSRDTMSMSDGGKVIPDNSNIAKLNVDGMKQLLEQKVEDQPEHIAASDLEHELKEVQNNHGYVAENYNPTDVAEESPQYDSGDVVLTGMGLQGIFTMKVENSSPAANTELENVSDVFAKLNKSNDQSTDPIYANEMPINMRTGVSSDLRISV